MIETVGPQSSPAATAVPVVSRVMATAATNTVPNGKVSPTRMPTKPRRPTQLSP